MQTERKKIIRFALDHDIKEIHTYGGYKGDLIVKITSGDRSAVIAIRKFALSLGIKEVVIKQNPKAPEFEIYCVTPDEEAHLYHLKPDDEDEVKKHHLHNDVWSGTIHHDK